MHSTNSQCILFKPEDEKISVDVRMDEDTVWLTQEQMVMLFDKGRSTSTEHILNIFKEGELDKKSTCRNFRQVRTEGNRTVERDIEHYNLDVIISVGYRVKSLRGTQFRIWATKRLNEYIRKGFTMDDERLKNLGGEKLLQGAGTISQERAAEKATSEYKKYQQKTLSEVEKTI